MRDFIGVSFHKASGKFRAQKVINGVTRYFGYYPTPEEAYQALIKEGYGPGSKDFSALVRTLAIVAGVTLAEADKVVSAISTVGLAIVPINVTSNPGIYDTETWIAMIEAVRLDETVNCG